MQNKEPPACLDRSEEFVKDAILTFPEEFESYQEGKESLKRFFLAHVMKISKGCCNPALVLEALERLK